MAAGAYGGVIEARLWVYCAQRDQPSVGHIVGDPGVEYPLCFDVGKAADLNLAAHHLSHASWVAVVRMRIKVRRAGLAQPTSPPQRYVGRFRRPKRP